MATGGRKTQLQVTHTLSKTINYNDTGITAGVVVGILRLARWLTSLACLPRPRLTAPRPLRCLLAPRPRALSLSTPRTSALGRLALTLWSRLLRLAPYASDTTIYASVAFGGTTGSAGVATVVVEYCPNIG